MIKVSVMYPNKAGVRFNHEYYRDKHMPLVKSRMGDSCKYYTVDKGLGGGTPGSPPTYVGMCHIFLRVRCGLPGRLRPACRGNHGRHTELHRPNARHPDQRGHGRVRAVSSDRRQRVEMLHVG